MTIDRRTLLRNGCMAATAPLWPKWRAAGPLRTPGTGRKSSSADTVLVVVQLMGGNDGLNTVIPIADPVYRSARPHVGLTPEQTLRVDAQTGLHPNLPNLFRHLNEGRLAIVQGVGYPAPDLSHFRSTDIWESGVAESSVRSGWLGRALNELYSSNPDALHSIAWGDSSPNAFGGVNVLTPAVFDPDHFLFETDGQDDDAKRRALGESLTSAGARERDYIAKVGEVALADSAILHQAIASYQSTVVYPDSPMGFWLRLTATAIFADIGPRVYWNTQGDAYDTHATQRGVHDGLLADLDACLDAFYRDCVLHGADQKVVVMTWSEFGRRVEENDSGGTDHGTSAPMFVFGSKVRGGLFGEPPSLTDLDPDGNLKYAVDFRRVYASMLANWIDVDPKAVLYNDYPTLEIL